MAIVGGAVMPMAMGAIADIWSMSVGFVMPLFCFIVIGLYGFFWQSLKDKPQSHLQLHTDPL